MRKIVPEIMPESMLQHEHEASSSARSSAGDIEVRSPEHIASSSAAMADVETLSKSLLECLRAILQLDPCLVRRDIGGSDALQAAEASVNTIPRPVLSKYVDLLERTSITMYGDGLYRMVNLLVKMIDEHSQLLMEMCPTYQRTFLHVAVKANFEVQVQKVVHMILADNTSSNTRDDLLSRKMNYLFAVEKSSGFTALQMAYIVGNHQIIRMIQNCEESLSSMAGSKPALSTQSVVENETSPPGTNREGRERQVHIKDIGMIVKCAFPDKDLSKLPLEYMALGDEFGFHICLTSDAFLRNYEKEWRPKIHGLFDQLVQQSLIVTFRELGDTTGKTILHYLANIAEPVKTRDGVIVYVNDNVALTIFQLLRRNTIYSGFDWFDMNVRDNMGRTPLHLAAALGLTSIVHLFATNHTTNLNLTFDMLTCELDGQSHTTVSVRGITPVLLAVTHNHVEVVKTLLSFIHSRYRRPLNVELRVTKPMRSNRTVTKDITHVSWTPLQVAALEGHVETLEVLLADNWIHDSIPEPESTLNALETAPALHIAALGGKPRAVKALLKNNKIDPFAVDSDGNTALHYALMSFNYEDCYVLWKYINLTQPFGNTPVDDSKNYAGIIGCIDLLLQAGLDMDQPNNEGKAPHFPSQTPPDVQRWWNDKVTSELQVTKNNLSAATNAVSVTAALVATTSFVGPLQPPLGLSTNTDKDNLWLLGYSQVNHVDIDVFLFCDCLSFYFAIASIMLALIPSLPIQHEGVFLGVKNAQRYLQGAVVLLFASITSLICTFISASEVITPGGRWKYSAMTVSTTLFGCCICTVVLVLFVNRLWRLTSPKRHYRPFARVTPRKRPNVGSPQSEPYKDPESEIHEQTSQSRPYVGSPHLEPEKDPESEIHEQTSQSRPNGECPQSEPEKNLESETDEQTSQSRPNEEIPQSDQREEIPQSELQQL